MFLLRSLIGTPELFQSGRKSQICMPKYSFRRPYMKGHESSSYQEIQSQKHYSLGYNRTMTERETPRHMTSKLSPRNFSLKDLSTTQIS